MFGSKQKGFVDNASITVDTALGLISRVYVRDTPLPTHVLSPDVDLRGRTVFPGFVDAHTHIFLHAYSNTPATNQMRDESLVERVI